MKGPRAGSSSSSSAIGGSRGRLTTPRRAAPCDIPPRVVPFRPVLRLCASVLSASCRRGLRTRAPLCRRPPVLPGCSSSALPLPELRRLPGNARPDVGQSPGNSRAIAGQSRGHSSSDIGPSSGLQCSRLQCSRRSKVHRLELRRPQAPSSAPIGPPAPLPELWRPIERFGVTLLCTIGAPPAYFSPPLI